METTHAPDGRGRSAIGSRGQRFIPLSRLRSGRQVTRAANRHCPTRPYSGQGRGSRISCMSQRWRLYGFARTQRATFQRRHVRRQQPKSGLPASASGFRGRRVGRAVPTPFRWRARPMGVAQLRQQCSPSSLSTIPAPLHAIHIGQPGVAVEAVGPAQAFPGSRFSAPASTYASCFCRRHLTFSDRAATICCVQSTPLHTDAVSGTVKCMSVPLEILLPIPQRNFTVIRAARLYMNRTGPCSKLYLRVDDDFSLTAESCCRCVFDGRRRETAQVVWLHAENCGL